MKRHFYAVTKGLILTFEECYTLLVEIEAVLNSRPLTPLSNDPRDLSVLTPSHLLIGDNMIQPVQNSYLETPDNRLSRWQHLQKARQDFWLRWQREYLSELQHRHKWTKGDPNLQEGTLVLLKEDHLPPLQWALGRIVAVHPGADGEVRVVLTQPATPPGETGRQERAPTPRSAVPSTSEVKSSGCIQPRRYRASSKVVGTGPDGEVIYKSVLEPIEGGSDMDLELPEEVRSTDRTKV
ncbi:hypothetical protein RF55_10035 [Lasius niger]|uniref:DUF5641 domain-containing protein n=1 Tax=Lasius niger TaxID=67767 RepID=A0A0J7KJ05_LASNI|nr:hypothetical protein RF55_10035 [Lasius niger]